MAGNVLWVAKDKHGNHLMEHSQTQKQGGKGGGGPSTTTYTYTASCAVGLCRSGRNLRVKKVWADDVVIYDAINNVDPYHLRFYDGSEAQQPDPLILAAEGAAPAYRGWVYFVAQDLPLKDFANRLPNWRATIESDPVTVGNIAGDLALDVGLVPADLDLSRATDPVSGYVVGSRVTAQDALAPVLSTYAYDLTEVDGLLRPVKRGGAPVLTIDAADLGAAISGGASASGGGSSGGDAPRIEARRAQDVELPGRIDLTYFDLSKDYEQGTQSDVRQTAPVQNALALTLSLSLSATEARQIAARELDTAWTERESCLFSLPPRYAALAPADVVLLPTDFSASPAGRVLRRVRIVSIEMGLFGELRLSAVADDADALVQTVPGAPPVPTGATGLVMVPTDFLAWSGAELRDQDQLRPGFYVAATGAAGWSGAAIFYSPDNGQTWVSGGTVLDRSVIGMTGAALGNGTDRTAWDTANAVGVALRQDGQLGSTSDNDVLYGGNAAALGGEILGFATATLTAPQSYTLSRLRRGVRASPMTGHVAGERFALATPALARVNVPDILVGQTVLVKCVSNLQALADAAAQSVLIAPRTPTAVEQQVGTQQQEINTQQQEINQILASGVADRIVTLATKAITFPQSGQNYRLAADWSAVGVFSNLLYSAALLSDSAGLVVERNTNGTNVGRAVWTVYVPTSGGYGYGPVVANLSLMLKGSGWTGAGADGIAAQWIGPILADNDAAAFGIGGFPLRALLDGGDFAGAPGQPPVDGGDFAGAPGQPAIEAGSF